MTTLALITAAVQATSTPAAAPPEPAANLIELAVPSLDGGRGLAAGYERWLPRYRLGVTVTGQLRESATGDYGALRTGIGVELRWYWRASAWRSAQPAGSMVGWFVGQRVDASIDAIHDRQAGRWLDTTLSIEVAGIVGYRIAPWRGLAITPWLGTGLRHDADLSGRIPGWTRPTLVAGLDLGWMF